MNEDRYNLYLVDPSMGCYYGTAIISAKDAEDANQIINDFKNRDKDNSMNSRGYSNVSEGNIIEDAFGTERGILVYGIHYGG